MSQPSKTKENYQVYLRIRPVDFQQKMTEPVGQNQIYIRVNDIIIKKKNQDPTQKNGEKQYFKFSQVFDSNASQELIFQNVCKPLVDEFRNGNNACFVAYGQSGSGKTYTIFGDDHRTANPEEKKLKMGCVQRTVEYILSKSKTIILKASLTELYLDKVRDLLKPNAGYLNIIDNMNGQVMVENLTQIEITQLSDVDKIIEQAFEQREGNEQEGRIKARAHCIFSLRMIYYDQNEIDDPKEVQMQFVDLAGSERIAKTLKEGQKYQEAILINNSLTILGKCLNAISSQKQSKLILYRESKLTQLLQSCIQPTCFVNLIATITPSESNYEECLQSLQFLDRTKNIQIKGQQITQVDQEKTPQNAQQEKLLRRMTDENNELKERIEAQQKEFKQKLKDLQKILGIDIDIEKLNSKQNLKEINQFKQQREALIKADNIQKRNEEFEQKIEILSKQIETLKKEESVKQEKYSCQILELKEQNRKLKDQIIVLKMSHEDSVRQLNNEREQLIKRMIEKSNLMLEEKVNNIVNLPQAVQTKTNENQKLQEVKKATKTEAEKEFKNLLDQIKAEYHKLMLASKEQYEFYLKEKNTEIESFLSQFKKYREKKKFQQNEIKLEMFDIHDIIVKQQKVIDKIEAGGYSAGIKSFNIPQKDKPILPNRQKHPNLFKFLDDRSIQSTKQSFPEDDVRKSQHLRTSQQKPTQIVQNRDREEIRINIGSTQTNLQQSQINESDLNANINKMDIQTLRNYTEKIREQLEKMYQKEKEFRTSGLQNVQDITAIIKERDELKQLYSNEIKKYNQARITLESQKRLLGKLQQDEPQIRVRPMSSVQKKKIPK